MRIGALFAGAGMLERGVQAVLGGDVAWHAETGPAASKVLAHNHPGVPNLGDVTAVNWSRVAPVDVLTAGWPCQPWSSAGQRRGVLDERALWPEVARAVCVVRPRLCVLENVRGIIAAGELQRAVSDLAALGYVGSYECLRADTVGAPHRRERIFIVAHAADPGQLGSLRPGGPWGRGAGLEDHGVHAADAGRIRPGRTAASGQAPGGWAGELAGRRDDAVAHPDDDGCPQRAQRDGGPQRAQRAPLGDDTERRVVWGQYWPAVQRWERVTGRLAPEPTVTGARGGRHRLSPPFVEWLMGWPEGWVTSVPGLTRSQQLAICGNGVVPAQAAAAVSRLLEIDTGRAAA